VKIAFIGGGNMGGAILAAILKEKLAAAADINVSEPLEERRQQLKGQYGVAVTGSNAEAVRGADVVILAVKPQILEGVMAEIGGKFQAGQLVISILAGKSLKNLTAGLRHQSVVRAMPNTPAQIGKGITVWTATSEVTEKQQEQAADILGATGKQVFSPDEAMIDKATAISGSGPAYVFLFAEALIEAAEGMDMPADMARKLVLATLEGATGFALSSDKSLAELRKMVTSPGGTTAAALKEFADGGFSELIEKAVKAAHRRAGELGS
jgi:pyrroline-5-carboxylate reductase